MKKPRRRVTPAQRTSGSVDRIRQLFEEADEQVARFFQQLEPEPHLAHRSPPRRPKKRASQQDSSA